MIQVSFDGGCGPFNPGGEMGYAAIIHLGDKEEISLRGSTGAAKNNSNNVAEYLGLLLALDWLIDHECCDAPIKIKGDSRLVIEQMKGRWRIKKGLYKDHALDAQAKARQFTNLAWMWVSREHNATADTYARSGQAVQRLYAYQGPSPTPKKR